MDPLQAMVTGMLMGALTGQDALRIKVEPKLDSEGNYLPVFMVTGLESGTVLYVTVTAVEDKPRMMLERDEG